jgi:hypothetical protein
MDLNSFLFPAPESSYTIHAAIGDLLFIPRTRLRKVESGESGAEDEKQESSTSKPPIPCLYMPNAAGSSKLLIYFHGNAEDVGLACEMLDYVRSLLKVHVLAIEYPGYGIYDGSPNAE